MSVYYVYSGAAGLNNGSSWANAFTTLTTAFATEVAGDTLYVAHDHAESSASLVTLSPSGTATNPTKIVCVDRSGSVPPVAADLRATATVTTTGTASMLLAGHAHYDGIIFSAGSGSTGSCVMVVTTGSSERVRLDNCSLRLGITAGISKIYLGGDSSYTGTLVELNNTTLSFAATTHSVRTTGTIRWRNTPSALIGVAVPDVLLNPLNSGGIVECFGVDLSAAGSGKILCAANAATAGWSWRFVDCKLNASVTKAGTPAALGSAEVNFIRCGASGINYGIYNLAFTGSLVEETTIVRSGGASDGTTPIAWKIVTSTGSNYSTPYECPPIAIWNDTTGSSVTATIEGIWGGGAVPNDDDVWIEVEYLGDASSPQGTIISDAKASVVAAAAGQTTSSATWGGSTTKFKLAVTFTPQQKGMIIAKVKCAKTSSTFYIDPLIALS